MIIAPETVQMAEQPAAQMPTDTVMANEECVQQEHSQSVAQNASLPTGDQNSL